MAVPSGTVTFLFTDIEGSTHLWQAAPEAMRQSLERHDAIVRRAIEVHGGYVFSTGGDGFAAAFARAGEAVAAAVEAQRGLGAEPWPEDAPLRVRMGVHTGEVSERDGDYFGSTVNRASRLMGVAHGGQIVVSEATHQLIADTEQRDLGEHRLRDLTRPERVFQVLGESLTHEFPPLRSLDAFPTNLPLELTSFVGRGREMKELHDVVIDHRLVTITGVGGVGKTRLAVQLGAELAPEFSGGVWLCELATVGDGDSLAQVIAISLGVAALQGMSLLESVVEFLRSKQLLLIVDNCEHVLRPAADLIGAILHGCAGVTVLATSREGLGISGEQLWPLRSLDVGDTDAPNVGDGSEAEALFSERARAVDPSFSIDVNNAGHVAEICRRLDGLPLAIELAAARIGAMSPSEIASLLDERFRLLTGGRKRAVDRHQTLRGTVDWSYSLLSPLERTVFDRLGVFAGSFDSTSAQRVATDDAIDRFDVLDALTELVAKSMLGVVRSDSERTRYELLETLRQYGLEKLEAADADGIRRRHAQCYAELASDLGKSLMSPDEIPARELVALELDNLRNAMAWALDRDDPEDQVLGVRIVASLGVLVSTMRSGGFGSWAERAVTASRSAPDGLGFAVLGSAAFSATARGDLETAKVLSDDAFALATPDTCPYRTAAFVARAITMYTTDLSAATEFLRTSADELEQIGDTFSVISLRSTAGMFAALSGDADAGHTLTGEALSDARVLRNPTILALALYGFALAWWQDDPDQARTAIKESLSLTEIGASDVVYADALELLGRLERASGNIEGALLTIARSLRESTRVGNRPSVISSQWYLAEALGLLEHEVEVGAILHGYSTQGPEAGLMPAVGGREGQLHEQSIDALRAALGAERFEDLSERGAAMNYETAVQYTLGELERITEANSPSTQDEAG